MKKKVIVIVAILVIAIVSTVVYAQAGKSNKSQVNVESNTKINIKHELGEVSLNKNPKKVVVFDYGIVDALDKMGVEIAALPKGSLPTFLQKYKDDKYTDVGTLKEPNFEKIFEVKPDLIIISGRQATLYEEFKKIAPTVYMAINNEDYMASFKNNMITLGNIFDKKDVVDKELKVIENKVKVLNEKATASSKNALVVLVNEGAMSAYGQVSRFGVIHNSFGFPPVDKNIEVSTHGQSISFEYIVEKNPDYLFVVDRNAIVGGSTTANKTLENELIKSTSAFKNNHIIYLDPEVWYTSTGGFTSTAKMVDEVQATVK
ncbi:siderophore ABC transporter substrate-binding protein [Clostridium swellfunianum]|uniref:siderophore ABC transporter substrate-binding protein n=1 Tax=Clostridium swellfunianum TaxID=1367462 RepID=UPI00202FE6B8|nr:siderophore ABC transporter substrate-binding protein [Clostridium swellfunianum]MCM0647148.1 siderophore ABC transporter substrate-binding protein [Clostridium swellfunianum]